MTLIALDLTARGTFRNEYFGELLLEIEFSRVY